MLFSRLHVKRLLQRPDSVINTTIIYTPCSHVNRIMRETKYSKQNYIRAQFKKSRLLTDCPFCVKNNRFLAHKLRSVCCQNDRIHEIAQIRFMLLYRQKAIERHGVILYISPAIQIDRHWFTLSFLHFPFIHNKMYLRILPVAF